MLTRGYLLREYGVVVDIEGWLERYQVKEKKSDVRITLKMIVERLGKIAKR